MFDTEGTFLTVKEFMGIIEENVIFSEKDIRDWEGNVFDTIEFVKVNFTGMKTAFENLILINDIQKVKQKKNQSFLFSVPCIVERVTKGEK